MFVPMGKLFSRSRQNDGYSLTADDEEALGPEKLEIITENHAWRGRWQGQFLMYCNIIMFLFSLTLFWTSMPQRDGRYSTDRNRLLKATNSYSPLLDAVEIPLSDLRVNGTLLNMHKSIYRQPPSPQVDAAWARLGNLDAIALTTEEVLALGKDPTKTARYPESFGLGPNAHMAELDATHHFHCLDVLRKDIDFDYYFADKYPDGMKPEMHRVHTSHCLYILLQNLMCSVSTDVIVLDWVEGQQAPFPDFNINRECRNFEAILEYQKEVGINGNVVARVKAPEGQERVPMSQEFLDLFEVSEENRMHHTEHESASQELD